MTSIVNFSSEGNFICNVTKYCNVKGRGRGTTAKLDELDDGGNENVFSASPFNFFSAPEADSEGAVKPNFADESRSSDERRPVI